MSSRLVLLVEHALQRAVISGFVGESVLPAVPDDVEPGAGEDADGVGVVVAGAVTGVAVAASSSGGGGELEYNVVLR